MPFCLPLVLCANIRKIQNTKANNKTSTLNIRTDYNRPLPIFITIDIKERERERGRECGERHEKNKRYNRKKRNTYSVIMAMWISEYLPMRGNAHKFYSLLRIDSKLKVIECKKFCVMWMRNVIRKVRCKWILWIPDSKALLHTCQCTQSHTLSLSLSIVRPQWASAEAIEWTRKTYKKGHTHIRTLNFLSFFFVLIRYAILLHRIKCVCGTHTQYTHFGKWHW